MNQHPSGLVESTPKYLKISMLGLFAAASINSAYADPASWTGGAASGDWSNANNWSGPPTVVPGAGDLATFDGAGGGQTLIDVSSLTSLGNLTFDTASAAAYTFGTGAPGDQTMEWGANGGNRTIRMESTVTQDQLFNAIVKASAGAGRLDIVQSAPGQSMTFASDFITVKFGNITAAPGATINMLGAANSANNAAFKGGGTLNTNSVNSNKSFTNQWGIVNFNGTGGAKNLTLGEASAGNGDAVFNIKNTSGANVVTVLDSLRYRADSGTANLGIVNGDATTLLLLDSASIDAEDNAGVSGAELTINADIEATSTGSGSGPIDVTGAGTVSFNGVANHTTGWDVQNGLLLFNGTGSSGPTTVQIGAALGGTGTIDGDLNIASDGILNFDLITAPGSHDKLDVNGTFTFDDTFSELTISSSVLGATTGVFTLVTSANPIVGSLDDMIVNLPAGWTADAPMISGNNLTINITGLTAPPANLTWNGSTGDWDIATTANWLGGDMLFHDGDSVTFDEATSVGTVTLASDVAPENVTVTNTTTPFQFDGFTITFDGVFNSSAAGGATVNSQLAGTGSLVASSSTPLTLTGDNSFSGGATASAGTINVQHNSALGTGTASIDGSNGTLELGVDGLTITNPIAMGTVGGQKILQLNTLGAASGEVSGPISISETGAFRTNINAMDTAETLTVSGLISETVAAAALSKRGAGTVRLTNAGNNFAGELHIHTGTVEATTLTDIGLLSSIGAGSLIKLGENDALAALSYTGAAPASTDRQITIGDSGNTDTIVYTSSAILRANGATPADTLVFTNAALNVQDTASGVRVGERSLTLGGANTGNNEIQGAIIDNAGGVGSANTVHLIKEDPGKWIASGTNTYTGNTTVNGGTLCFTTATSLPAGGDISIEAAAGAVLNLDFGGTITVGKLFIDGAAVPIGVYGNSTGGITGAGMLNVTETQSNVDPQITSISVSGGVATITITGGANTTYVCTSSDDLVTAFAPIATTPATVTTDGSGDATFTVDASVTKRFYIVED